MGTYEIKLEAKKALDNLVKSLEKFHKEYPIKEGPLYNTAFKFLEYANKERGKYKRETKKLEKLMGE